MDSSVSGSIGPLENEKETAYWQKVRADRTGESNEFKGSIKK